MKGYKKVNIEELTYAENKNVIIDFIIERKILLFIIIAIIIVVNFLCFHFIFRRGGGDNIKKNLGNSNDDYKSNYENINNKDDLYQKVKEYEESLRKITNEEVEEFMTINSLGILYDKTKYKRSETPDITIITTMRNQAHCIHKAIRSVQNQSLKNIEMIIIDDCSLDNSTETVENFMKEDERIILYKHDNINEGIMITRNEGIRMAKGKYIAILDADDTFIHKDILKNSLHVANLANLDVVEFYTSVYKNHKFEGYFHHHNFPILYQPELKTAFFRIKEAPKYRPIKCRTVWGKIVKNEVFQKTLDNIPDKYLYDYILGFEDTMITVSLYQIAQSYYCLRQPGYYYSLDEKRNRFPESKKKKCRVKDGIVKGIDHIKFLQFLVDKLDDDELSQKVLFYEIKAINEYNYSNFKKTITHHFDWAYSIFDGLLNSKYLDEKQKKYLQQIKDEIKENQNKKLLI